MLSIGLCMLFVSLFSFFSGMSMLYYKSMVYIGYNIFMLEMVKMDFILVFDWISLLFFSLVMLISFSVFMYSEDYMMGDITMKRFYWLVFMFVGSMGLMIFSPNMISIMLGWDGLGVISYCLVIYYQSIKSYGSGMITFLSNRIGDIGMIFGMGWMMMYGSWNIFSGVMFYEGGMLMFLLLMGAFTKSAQIPFSSWLPAAMAAPTPVSSLVHSSTLVTAGVYLLIRFNEYLNMSGLIFYVGCVSMFTMMISGLSALSEMDMKKVIALSTLSQLGMMVFLIYIGMWWISYMHMLIHAIFKSMMFLSGGAVIHGAGSQDFRFMGGISMMSPIAGLGMMISCFSLGGVPFMSGFYSKDLGLESMLENTFSLFMIFMMVFCCVLTSIYGIRMIWKVMVDYMMNVSYSIYGESDYMIMSILLMSFFSVVFGSVVSWFMFEYDLVVVMFMVDKVMIFMIFFSGFIVIMIIMIFKINNMRSNFSYFLGKMGFLGILSLESMLVPVKIVPNINLSEGNWIEEMGGQGLNHFMMVIYKFFESYNFMIMIYLFLVLIFLMW